MQNNENLIGKSILSKDKSVTGIIKIDYISNGVYPAVYTIIDKEYRLVCLLKHLTDNYHVSD